MSHITVEPVQTDDRAWITRFLSEHWGAPIVVSRNTVHQANQLPGFIAMHQGQRAGLITYDIKGDQCEIVTLDSTLPGHGAGSALIEALLQAARAAGCRRVWLITTNDNLHALRFYQKRGFTLVAIHRNAVTEARKIKPQISLLGNDGIPIRDEIELEYLLHEPRLPQTHPEHARKRDSE